MASRVVSRSIRSSMRAHSSQLSHHVHRNYASAAGVSQSSLSQQEKEAIQREASLPNSDPAPDSQTARVVNEQLPYMVPTYARPPPMFHKAEGCYLWDIENRRYLDFTAGIAVNGLGHCDPGLAKIISEQSQMLMHTSNLYHNPWTGLVSKTLVEKTLEAGGMHTASKAFICNSGSEANEAALKFARKVGKSLDPDGTKHKHEILSFTNSFHGRTMGSLSATPNPKYQRPFAPMLPGFHYATYNDPAALDLITPSTAGVIIEPIQGEGGVWIADPAFLRALRAKCTAVGAVLIYDEIQSGLGRTGNLWAHADLPIEAHPDIVTTAKALGNGFPVGATIVNDFVAGKIVIGDHGTTFGGNPLACRVAHYCVTRLADAGLQREVVRKGEVFREQFEGLKAAFPEVVKEIRGKGLILGLQLDRDPTPIVKAARERGLLVITAGTNTLRFVPPLVISDEEIKEGMAILADAFQ
ncbi:acetylornithine and succinylornithine aminotransferase, partial [Eremomyces bilateralis CBS 781.70]